MTNPELARGLVTAAALIGLVPAGWLLRAGLDWLSRPRYPGRQLLGAGLGLPALLMAGVAVVWLRPSSWLAVVSLFCCLLVGWTSALFLGWQAWSLRHGTGGVGPVDYVIVLGAGLLGDRVPPVLASRIDTAVEIHRSQSTADGGRRPLLVMSGGRGSDEQVSEAAAMARYAMACGVPATDVVLEDRSTTTWQNLEFSSRLVSERLGGQGLGGGEPGDGARGVVVSNDFHTLRASWMARTQGLDLGFVDAPTVGVSRAAAQLREFGAVAYQWPLRFAVASGLLPLLLTVLVLA